MARHAAALLAYTALTVALTWPLALQLGSVVPNDLENIEHFSADLVGLITTPHSLALGNSLLSWDKGEAALSPGAVAVALVIAGLVAAVESRQVRGVALSLGAFPGGFPRELSVMTSDSGTEWAAAWNGDVAALALQAAITDPRDAPIRLPFTPPARALHPRQAGVPVAERVGRRGVPRARELTPCLARTGSASPIGALRARAGFAWKPRPSASDL